MSSLSSVVGTVTSSIGRAFAVAAPVAGHGIVYTVLAGGAAAATSLALLGADEVHPLRVAYGDEQSFSNGAALIYGFATYLFSTIVGQALGGKAWSYAVAVIVTAAFAHAIVKNQANCAPLRRYEAQQQAAALKQRELDANLTTHEKNLTIAQQIHQNASPGSEPARWEDIAQVRGFIYTTQLEINKNKALLAEPKPAPPGTPTVAEHLIKTYYTSQVLYQIVPPAIGIAVQYFFLKH